MLLAINVTNHARRYGGRGGMCGALVDGCVEQEGEEKGEVDCFLVCEYEDK